MNRRNIIKSAVIAGSLVATGGITQACSNCELGKIRLSREYNSEIMKHVDHILCKGYDGYEYSLDMSDGIVTIDEINNEIFWKAPHSIDAELKTKEVKIVFKSPTIERFIRTSCKGR